MEKAESDGGSSSLRGFLLSLAGTTLLSIAFVAANHGLEGFAPEAFSLVWSSAAAIYVLLIMLVTGQRRQLALPKGTVTSVLTLGVLTGSGMLLAWQGLDRLDPGFASLLWRFSPLITISFSAVLLRERLSSRELLPAALMIGGSIVSALGQWHIVAVGMLLTLLANFVDAVQRVMAKVLLRTVHPNALAFYRSCLGAFGLAAWVIFGGKTDFEVPFRYWLSALLGAFLGPCASFLLTYQAYRHWDLSRCTLVLTAQPLLVLPMVYVASGDFPSRQELLGGAFILTGAFWFVWLHSRGAGPPGQNQTVPSPSQTGATPE
jgi:drug/metabolite transporter (DMT)-like permease